MRFLYNIALYFFGFSIRLSALFNPKAALWIKGRKNWRKQFPNNKNKKLNITWFHCASLGEFEQGRPLLEKWKLTNPHTKILLTFFSPSGYEIRKNYDKADWVVYLPLDTSKNMHDLIDLVQPSMVFVIKYEFWFNMLNALFKINCKTYLVSGKFRKEHFFFQKQGQWFLSQLRQSFTHFFVQDEASFEILGVHGIVNVSVVGDTRVDRVLELSEKALTFTALQKISVHKKVIVGGSLWVQEIEFLKLIYPQLNQDVLLIIAPHEVSEKTTQDLLNSFSNAVAWKNIEHASTETKVVVLDSIGVLSSLYQYGHLAIIGGGFGHGIHNILEPACFGLPVLFGPNYHKFSEAIAMLKNNTAFSFASAQQLSEQINQLLYNADELNLIKQKQQHYLQQQKGACQKIIDQIGGAA